MIGHDEVMFTAALSDQVHVTAALPGNRVLKDPQRGDQLPAGDVPGKFHAAMTSSRTK